LRLTGFAFITSAMPHNPHEQFDQSVLDLIEHSPVGAAPRTPTHLDAVKRLYAAHQVYAAADWKDGHVTARSLARLPTFHAANLGELIAGQIAPEALEPNAALFDRYVQSLSADRRAKAESRRLVVAGKPVHHRPHHGGTAVHDRVHSLFLVPGGGPHPGLPGNYLYGSVYETGAEAHPWAIGIHDNDDGVSLFEAATLAEALAKLQEVLESAPFSMDELEAFGFRLV
jgi:hypothetical protein